MVPRHVSLLLLLLVATLLPIENASSADVASSTLNGNESSPCISGRYPHLAMFNPSGECGIGAVVPWAGRLWAITYPPHQPFGSKDFLYEIDESLRMTIRPESIGGTPADRMIHRESNQLIIGPYFIDTQRNVRVIPYKKMPGRPTAVARHLTDPAHKVYFYSMEEGLYEVDVDTLDVTTLHKDAHVKGFTDDLPGYHGKGGYSGQGRLVVANNGERKSPHLPFYDTSGCLAEFNGKDWTTIETNQFCEVTGPGGIFGNAKTTDPLWATGWDKRSVLLKLLDKGQWHTFRLPIADYSYVAHHGWYTEWPRIREVVPATNGQPAKLLMNMHGQFFDFPKTLSVGNTAGLKPLSSYLKITGDYCNWRGQIVVACDDTSIMDNPLAGQSQSNLWFTSWDTLANLSKPVGYGGPWWKDDLTADHLSSEPYLFDGYEKRVVHLAHQSDYPVKFTLQLDRQGNGQWETYKTVEVPAKGYVYHIFPADLSATWVRVQADKPCAAATAYFHYGPSGGTTEDAAMFAGLARIDADGAHSVGVIRPRGGNLGTLQFLAQSVDAQGNVTPAAYYEIDKDMRLTASSNSTKEQGYMQKKAVVTKADFSVDRASVVITEGQNHWRLPKSHSDYDQAWPAGWPRGIREVATERNLLNCHGTFYVLPRATAGGFCAIKPVCTHNRRITDFCTWRGLLVLAGCRSDAPSDGHLVKSDDGQAALWFGDIDDLWRLGKPRGIGGPWLDTAVKAGQPSDPYLMTGYDEKTLALRHDAEAEVTFTVEVDFLRDGTWTPYATFRAAPGQTVEHAFPDGFSAHWVRITPDRDCTATAQLTYR